MAAKRLPTIFPPVGRKESIEITKIYSMAGLLPNVYGLIMGPLYTDDFHRCITAI
jgi:magnesium chelatase family protein